MNDYHNITDTIITVDQAGMYSQQIDEVIRLLFTNKTSVTDLFNKYLSLELKETVQECMDKEKMNVRDREKIKEFLTNINTSISKIPVITLTVAIFPKYKFVKQISDWLRKEAGNSMLLKINVEPSIIGGTVIQYNGIYKNYSLEKVLP
jgi:F0F1-type ATP synthase delta subunit